MKIQNLVRVQVLVSHSPPLLGSQESHKEKSFKDFFIDDDWSFDELPLPPHSSPLPHYPSPAFTSEPDANHILVNSAACLMQPDPNDIHVACHPYMFLGSCLSSCCLCLAFVYPSILAMHIPLEEW
ncbi:hypothetical protein E2C01_013805 [Portunus trituberculatus]|uniref:Uncharacterized protein n=1 Tax=Portunus trituberculatus TaxID=210409 RepID=A0A5B7DIC5_PORTR|nr:hypothetical protein [Portunus trituberculatus]